MAKVGNSRKSTSQDRRLNTLGAQGRTLDQLLDELDRQQQGRSSHRSHARWAFREKSIDATLRLKEGSEVQLKLAARNLSVGGVSLLHSAYVYPGTAITLALPLSSGGVRPVEGVVTRCQHVRGTIHELGVKFNNQINLREFQQADPLAGCFSYENIDPAMLKGTIVHIDPSHIDRQIVRHILRHSSLFIRGCESLQEALPHIERGCDLVMAEFNLPDSDGEHLASLIRAEGDSTPVLIVSSDTSEEAKERMRSGSVDLFVPKPIDPQRLIAAIAEFVAPESTHNDQKPEKVDEGLRDLAAAFSEGLPQIVKQLEAAASAGDRDTALRLALQLKGTAQSLGFGQIGRFAEETVAGLKDVSSLEPAIRPLRKLITACRCARPAA